MITHFSRELSTMEADLVAIGTRAIIQMTIIQKD